MQEAQREARLASCLATPGMTGQERSTGELLNSAVRRLAVASDVNTQLRCAALSAPVICVYIGYLLVSCSDSTRQNLKQRSTSFEKSSVCLPNHRFCANPVLILLACLWACVCSTGMARNRQRAALILHLKLR